MANALEMQFCLIDPEQVLTDSARRNNISGLALFDDDRRAALCTDEGAKIFILEQVREQCWQVVNTVSLLDNEAEADLESLAVDDRWLYAVGSHSARRKKTRTDKSRSQNRKRLKDFSAQPSRRILARIRLKDLLAKEPKVRDDKGVLWKEIQTSEILKPFTQIPSKENGVDIEGLAIDGDDLLIGFRGPVLRGNYAIVMRTQFRAKKSKLLYLDLGGRGVRDLCCIDHDRILILAGPVGDEPLSYQLYEWDGRDRLLGDDVRDITPLEPIDEVPLPKGYKDAKPEGIEVLHGQKDPLEVAVVYDSAPVGAPTVFRITTE